MGQISEFTDVTFTCLAEEANPTAELIWTVDGNVVNPSRVYAYGGRFGGYKRGSDLTLTANRTFNKKEVQCALADNNDIKKEIMLFVTCKE